MDALTRLLRVFLSYSSRSSYNFGDDAIADEEDDWSNNVLPGDMDSNSSNNNLVIGDDDEDGNGSNIRRPTKNSPNAKLKMKTSTPIRTKKTTITKEKQPSSSRGRR